MPKRICFDRRTGGRVGEGVKDKKFIGSKILRSKLKNSNFIHTQS